MKQQDADKSEFSVGKEAVNLHIRKLIVIQMVGIVLAVLIETIGRVYFLNFGSSYYGVRLSCTFLAMSLWTGVSLYVILKLPSRTWISRLVFAGTVLLLISLVQETAAYFKLFPFLYFYGYFKSFQNMFQEGTFVAGLAAMVSGFYLALFESERYNRLLQREHEYLQIEMEERRRAEEALNESQASLHRLNLELELRVEQRTQDLANANQRLQDEIEQRKSIAQSLITSEEKYRTLVENANNIIIRWQQDGTICFLNRFAQQLFQYGEEEIIGKKAQDTLLNLGSEGSLLKVVQGLFEEPLRRLESVRQHTRRDGSLVWISWTHSVSADKFSPDLEILSIGQDITTRKTMEMERENLQEELLQIQKLESIGRLAGGIAHDFNNMLSIIQMRTELAAAQSGLPPDAHFHLQAIQTAVGHSSDLTRQLLAFARHQKSKPRVLDVNQVMTEAVRMLQSLVTRDLQLHWEPANVLPKVCLDPVQLHQIITNITVNAMDALEGQGDIFIATEEVVTRDDAFLSRSEALEDSYVRIAIRDTGPGIDPILEGKVLDPFFTTKEEGKGTGLGLAVVYGIIKQNDGYLDLQNTPGEGLGVEVYFPACKEAASAPALQEPEKEITEEKRKSLLIIEKEGELLALLTTLLLKKGYKVQTASSPEAALELSKTDDSEIDLFIMNNLFPDRKAPELTEELLVQHPRAKLLLMSTLGDICDPVLEKLSNTIEVIEKPFKSNEFLAQVNNLIEKA